MTGATSMTEALAGRRAIEWLEQRVYSELSPIQLSFCGPKAMISFWEWIRPAADHLKREP